MKKQIVLLSAFFLIFSCTPDGDAELEVEDVIETINSDDSEETIEEVDVNEDDVDTEEMGEEEVADIDIYGEWFLESFSFDGGNVDLSSCDLQSSILVYTDNQGDNLLDIVRYTNSTSNACIVFSEDLKRSFDIKGNSIITDEETVSYIFSGDKLIVSFFEELDTDGDGSVDSVIDSEMIYLR